MSLTADTLYNFWILTVPRSGSHMLASALDGHPQIQCGAECWKGRSNFKQWLGLTPKDIVGTTMFHYNMHKMAHKPSKIILLLRDPETVGWYHNKKSTEPYQMKVGGDPKKHLELRELFARYQIELQEVAKQFDKVLVLRYEELTANKDCREIPEPFSSQICEFLEVEPAPLKPVFYKPQVIGTPTS